MGDWEYLVAPPHGADDRVRCRAMARLRDAYIEFRFQQSRVKAQLKWVGVLQSELRNLSKPCRMLDERCLAMVLRRMKPRYTHIGSSIPA